MEGDVDPPERGVNMCSYKQFLGCDSRCALNPSDCGKFRIYATAGGRYDSAVNTGMPNNPNDYTKHRIYLRDLGDRT